MRAIISLLFKLISTVVLTRFYPKGMIITNTWQSPITLTMNIFYFCPTILPALTNPLVEKQKSKTNVYNHSMCALPILALYCLPVSSNPK